MDDPGVTKLYRKVVSPSVKFKTEVLMKESHSRHAHYRGKSARLAHSARCRSNTYSAPPARVQSRQLTLQTAGSTGIRDNDLEQDGRYNFHPTTRFKTTSLPAMTLTSRYAHTANGSTRTVPLSAMRHSTLSLPEKWPVENSRISFTSQQQRKSAEEKAKDECRRLKRKSEIIYHRIDKQYYMSGTKLPIKSRWEVDGNDLLRLKLLAHHKQLGHYRNTNKTQHELQDARESPGGQMSTPTPYQGKGDGAGGSPSEHDSPNGTEGKWAENGKSEASSIDEFDSISMRGRRIDLSLDHDQHDSNSSGDVDSQSTDEQKPAQNIDETLEKENENAQNNEAKLVEESVARDVKLNEDKNTGNEQTRNPLPEKTLKKVKNIRFQDDINKKNSKGSKYSGSGRGKGGKLLGKTPDSQDTNKDGPQGDHVNQYLDEWLGVKKKEVDGRYKPGKPPPNRIFISAEISKSKRQMAKRLSEMFLSETIGLQESEMKSENTDDLTPESKFGIINPKQRDAFSSMFSELDKDKNGSLTLQELKLKMMPSVSRDDVKLFVQVFDLNKDKTVDSREFTAICSLNDKLAGMKTETADGSIALELEKLAQHIVIFKEMYKTIDEDDDNRLDVNEVLVMVSAAMETEMGADLSVARRVLEAAQDEFGYIDFVGFMSYIPFFAKLLNAITQNPLSIADIEKAREKVKQKQLTLKPKTLTKKEPKSWEVF